MTLKRGISRDSGARPGNDPTPRQSFSARLARGNEFRLFRNIIGDDSAGDVNRTQILEGYQIVYRTRLGQNDERNSLKREMKFRLRRPINGNSPGNIIR